MTTNIDQLTLLPVGSIVPLNRDTPVPEGFLPLDGRWLLWAEHPDLVEAIYDVLTSDTVIIRPWWEAHGGTVDLKDIRLPDVDSESTYKAVFQDLYPGGPDAPELKLIIKVESAT